MTLTALMLSVSCSTGVEQKTFSNPVIAGDLADPCIISYEGRYYAAGTSSEWAPFYPIYVSDDLVNWKQCGHVFDEKPDWTSSSFWAPELYCMNGKVYCYYTARRKSDGVSYIGVAVADSPEGEFKDHGLLVEFGTEAIDAFVFDDDGQLYISWKAYGLDDRPIELVASRLSPDGLSLEGEPFSLMVDSNNIGMEGQCHLKIGDWYYIIYSSRACCGPASDYEVRLARARSYEGPYEEYPDNPVLFGGEGEFRACGHGTVVYTEDKRMFYLCHSYLKGDGFYLGRQPVLHELECSEDAWLRFKEGNTAQITLPMPFESVVQNEPEAFCDDFSGENLSVEWSWNYPYSDVSAYAVDGYLLLSGKSLDGNLYGSALCLRPVSKDYSCETELKSCSGSLAGITCYGDAGNLLIFGQKDGKLVLVKVNDGLESLLYETDMPALPLYLRMNVKSGHMAEFTFSSDGTKWAGAGESGIDLSSFVRWDRVFRPGLITDAPVGNPSKFGHFLMYPSPCL